MNARRVAPSSPHVVCMLCVYVVLQCTGVLTNVPGPSHERSLAGQQVTDLMFWVPAVGSIGMVLSIITYAHALAVGKSTASCPFRPDDAKGFVIQSFTSLGCICRVLICPGSAVPGDRLTYGLVILCVHVSGLVVDETVPCDPDAFLRHFHAHFLHYERLAHANTDH